MSRSRLAWLLIGGAFFLAGLCALGWARSIGFQVWAPPGVLFWPLHLAWLIVAVIAIRKLGWLGTLALVPLVLLLPFLLFTGFLTYMCAAERACP